jgi:pimeloyl-ACP methyl ester carboxylesterase
MARQVEIPTAIYQTRQDVITESFYFSSLANQKKLADPGALSKLQERTGLVDLYWRVLYYQFPGEKKTFEEILAEVDGYVFFIHGWTGSHRIWENLPSRLTAKHKRIVCFNLDVNGFGLSPFVNETPPAEQCNPPGLMAAIEHWLAAISLWPATKRNHKPFYLFVGHSMGGAALFYKDETGWRNEAYGFYAMAPALICNDTQRQFFYKTLGTSIRLPTFAAVKNALAPHVLGALADGASAEVKSEHLRVFHRTPFGTVAQTFYALGAMESKPERQDWQRFRVTLGHKDRLVGLNQMLDLIEEFRFHPNQLRVTLGDHYFFSYGHGSPKTHQDNLDVVVDDLLAFCHRLTKEATGGFVGGW